MVLIGSNRNKLVNSLVDGAHFVCASSRSSVKIERIAVSARITFEHNMFEGYSRADGNSYYGCSASAFEIARARC